MNAYAFKTNYNLLVIVTGSSLTSKGGGSKFQISRKSALFTLHSSWICFLAMYTPAGVSLCRLVVPKKSTSDVRQLAGIEKFIWGMIWPLMCRAFDVIRPTKSPVATSTRAPPLAPYHQSVSIWIKESYFKTPGVPVLNSVTSQGFPVIWPPYISLRE